MEEKVERAAYARPPRQAKNMLRHVHQALRSHLGLQVGYIRTMIDRYLIQE
jgi:hypothetical protein